MGFDYVSDIYGKNRSRETRFTQLETRAINLLSSFVDKSISDKDFALAFDEIRKQFSELIKDNGEVTFDEDTPLWLNSLIGLHFMDWRKVQQLKWYFEEHPDELVGEMKERYDSIMQMGHDQRFQQACKDILEELRKIQA